MLPNNRTKRRKNIHQMPERCRILVPVSKGNRGNKKCPNYRYLGMYIKEKLFKIR
jgi:hypothetical protein